LFLVLFIMLYYLRLIIHSKHLNLYTLSLFSKIYMKD